MLGFSEDRDFAFFFCELRSGIEGRNMYVIVASDQIQYDYNKQNAHIGNTTERHNHYCISEFLKFPVFPIILQRALEGEASDGLPIVTTFSYS